jgi:hypothetical protein
LNYVTENARHVRNIADSIGNFAGIWQPNHLKRFLC